MRGGLGRVGALRGWSAAVAASAVIVAGVVVALGVGWLATLSRDDAAFGVGAPVTRVDVRVDAGDVEVRGGAPGVVRVRRHGRSAFGRDPVERRARSGSVLRVASRCPPVLVGQCSADYEVVVPDNVNVAVRTGSGTVRLIGFHGSADIATGSGDVTVDAFCGFGLEATTRSGDIRAIAACAPKTLSLNSTSGDASAVVPPGRYRLSIASGSGERRVSGVVPSPRAPFSIHVRSGSGAVSVNGGL